MATNTTYSGPPDWMRPYYEQFMQGAFQTANRPYQQYQGPRLAGMSSIQQGALGGINQAMHGNPQTQQAQGLLGNTMSEGDNPYVNQIARTVTDESRRAYDQATAGVNARFTNPNSFTGSRHALMQDQANEAFARGLSGSLANLRYGAYDTGRNRQMNAAGMANQFADAGLNRYMAGLS